MAQLVWLMGPSGSGKDSLLQALRQQEDCRLLVAHRYIARIFDAGCENHIALTEQEFSWRLQHGLFALCWQAHQQRYGIGIEIDHWLARGLTVVVNGSRQHLAAAQARYGKTLLPVCLQVSIEVLRQRLQQRGRESASQIEQRLARAALYKPDGSSCFLLDNNGSLAQTAAALLHWLASHGAAAGHGKPGCHG